jgi:hypothetical protein
MVYWTVWILLSACTATRMNNFLRFRGPTTHSFAHHGPGRWALRLVIEQTGHHPGGSIQIKIIQYRNMLYMWFT